MACPGRPSSLPLRIPIRAQRGAGVRGGGGQGDQRRLGDPSRHRRPPPHPRSPSFLCFPTGAFLSQAILLPDRRGGRPKSLSPGNHQWGVKIVDQGEGTDGSGLMLGPTPLLHRSRRTLGTQSKMIFLGVCLAGSKRAFSHHSLVRYSEIGSQATPLSTPPHWGEGLCVSSGMCVGCPDLRGEGAGS